MGNRRLGTERRWDLEQSPFAGLEELGARGTTPFDRFAKVDLQERAPARAAERFDVCMEMGPPPRLA